MIRDQDKSHECVEFNYHPGSYEKGSFGFKGMYSCCRLKGVKGKDAPGCVQTNTILMKEIGDVHFQAGEINAALKAYSRIRQELSQGINVPVHPGSFRRSFFFPGMKGGKWSCCGDKMQRFYISIPCTFS